MFERSKSPFLWSVTLFLCFLLSFHFVYAQLDSCTIGWAFLRQLSDGNQNYFDPVVLSDGDSIHGFWIQFPSGPYAGWLYSRSTDGGRSFSPQTQLLPVASMSGMPGAFFAVSHNYLYVPYYARVDSPVYSNLAVMRSTDGGVSWLPRKLFGDLMANAVSTLDSSVYIYFTYVDSPYIRGGLLRSHDYGTSWNTVYALPPVIDVGHILATPNALHLVLTRKPPGGDWEVYYYRSTDGGQSFSSPQILSANDHITSWGCQIAGDGRGNVFVTWREGKYGSIDGYHAMVALRRSTDNGATWGTEQILTSTPTAELPMIAEEDSIIAVAWNEYIAEFNDRSVVRTSSDYGVTWCDTTRINNLGWAVDISISRSFLHSMWETNEEIYYRRGNLRGYSDTGNVTIAYRNRWNMISLPVVASDQRGTTVFPSAISPAYSFTIGGYHQEDTLRVGAGYWLKFPAANNIEMSGGIILTNGVKVNAGWNLIGTISNPVAISSISTIPVDIISSQFYEYNNGYRITDTLKPGFGYWIKVKQSGKIILK